MLTPPPTPPPVRRFVFLQMCGSAGNAAKGFGFALQVDSTIKIEPPKPTAAALVSTSDEGSGEDDVQAAAAAAAAAATAAAAAAAAAAAKRRRSGSFGSREPVRAELLALQLNECASEMEEHLLVQVCTTYIPVLLFFLFCSRVMSLAVQFGAV